VYSGLGIQVYLLGRVSTAIFDEARTGVYGTVVIGRPGERKAFFMGSARCYALGSESLQSGPLGGALRTCVA
jgi:hypothetical protein